MKEIVSNLKTVIVESEDGKRRLSLAKIWDGSKPSLAIVMICPSSSGEVAVDTSSALSMANSYRLGFGSVTILNLFSEVNNFELKGVTDCDEENIKAIVAAAEKSDSIVLAWGNGRMKNKDFQRRVEQVLTALRPYEKKWKVICDAKGGSRGSHPLAPRARQWHLSSASLSDFKDIPIRCTTQEKGERESFRQAYRGIERIPAPKYRGWDLTKDRRKGRTFCDPLYVRRILWTK